MKKFLVKHILILSLIFVSVFAFSQESIQLKYAFIKGKTYLLTTQITNNVTQSMGGQEIKIEAGISSSSEMTIEDVDKEGNTTSLVTLKNASVYTKIPVMKRDTATQYKDLNEQRRVVLSSTGKQISVVKLGDEKVLEMMSSTEQFTKLQQMPGKVIKVGEKWNDKIIDSTKASSKNPINMNITTDMEYTLAGVEMKDGVELYKISYTGTSAINGKGIQMGMDVFIEGTGKTEGISYFDPKYLLIVNNEANIEMDMSIAVSGQQNMTMPMSQSIKAITKLEEKK